MGYTAINTMSTRILSPIFNVDILPKEMKNTFRFLPKIYHASYSCDVSGQFNLYYKKLYDDTESVLPLILPKSNSYMKHKLPRFLLCREFRFEIIFQNFTFLELIEAGIMWMPMRIGVR